jgi:hypothetical protein
LAVTALDDDLQLQLLHHRFHLLEPMLIAGAAALRQKQMRATPSFARVRFDRGGQQTVVEDLPEMRYGDCPRHASSPSEPFWDA